MLFCKFVKQVQAQNQVKNALIGLQQRLNLNVNILLFCCWTAQIGHKQMNKKDILDILAAISPWHEKIVLALKKLRKRAQQETTKPTLRKISKLILEKEIAANQIEQKILCDIMIKPACKYSKTQKFITACKNITNYCKELRNGMDHQDTEAIKCLLSTIFPNIDTKQITAYWGTSFTKSKNYNPHLYSQPQLDDLLY